MCAFGRPIKDFIPILPGRYKPHPTCSDTLASREEALRNRHMKTAERLAEHTRRLPPLTVGDSVRIQNQTGHHPTKLDKTDRIIEVRQYDQYAIHVDVLGRVTLRNRKFLRKYVPVQRPTPRRSIIEDLDLVRKSHFSPTVALTAQHICSPPVTTPVTCQSTTCTGQADLPNSEQTITQPVAIPSPSSPPVPSASDDRASSRPSLGHPPVVRKRPLLAVRRLMDLNSKGLKE